MGGADPEGFAISPYAEVNVRRNGGRIEVRQAQKFVPSQHEEDQTVLLPFPLFPRAVQIRADPELVHTSKSDIQGGFRKALTRPHALRAFMQP